jgi:hypothetical protein
MVIVEKFRQWLAQTFVALALIAEDDGTFEQAQLKFLRHIAPKVGRRCPKDEKITLLSVVASGAMKCLIHRATLHSNEV